MKTDDGETEKFVDNNDGETKKFLRKMMERRRS